MAKGTKNAEPEDQAKPEKEGSAEAVGAGEHAAEQPDDHAALGVAGTADVHSAADKGAEGYSGVAAVVNDPTHTADATAYALRGMDLGLADLKGTVKPDDPAIWAGYNAQMGSVRWMIGNWDYEVVLGLTLEQCVSISYLVRKSPDCAAAAMLKHLELMRIPFEWDRALGLYAAEIFRTVLRKSDAYLTAVEAAAARKPEPMRRKVPLDETTLELTEGPFALTETAKGR
ncbi:hypothetical protein FMN50_20350 [Rhodobacterales bacterium]|nr:hypothetical protein FMN50_20350 [Rhodobacterales bacterium]